MSAASALQATIHDSIPLSRAMQFSIDSLDLGEIRVSAPLEPNINIHGTGFAGSIYSVAVLTGWALCTHILRESKLDADLVVGNAGIRYLAPVTEDLECHCRCSEAQRHAFYSELRNAGKGRLVLEVEVGAQPQAHLEATFFAIADKPSA